MRYTYFEFENFKGIRRARLDLAQSGSAARVYTLVGLNESGKTTVLKAIDHFQPAADDEISPKQLGELQPVDPNSLIPIAERTNFNGEIIIRCGVELDDADVNAAEEHLRTESDGYRLESLDRQIEITDRYVYEDSRYQRRRSTWKGPSGAGYLKTGEILRPLTYGKDLKRWQLLISFIRARLPSIWFFPNFLFAFPERIYIESHDGEEDANRFYRALFQDLLDALHRNLDIEKHVVERYRSGVASDKANLRQVLLEAERHVTETVMSSWNQIFHDRPISEKRVTIEIGDDSRDDPTSEDTPGRIWVQFRIEDTDGLFAIGERSLGFQWFFVYLMLTNYRGQRKVTDDNMLYLFDEPASNLHPTAQHMLLTSFARLSSKAIVIYTTHSHYLIEPSWLGLTSVVANQGLGEQSVATDYTPKRTDINVTPYRQFVAGHPNQSHYFQPILDVLDYAPSAIDPTPDAVMVEGKTDFYLLRYYEEIVLGRSENERLRLMPGGGAGTLDALIQLYIGWARPFVALLDSDKEGRSQKKRYLDKFGPILDPHLVLLAEASDATGKGIESLLTAEDVLAFQRLIEADAKAPNKKLLGLGIQEALVTRQAVTLSANANKHLDATITHLRRKLMD